MKIHVVKSGETLESIAQQYGVTPELIISINELPNPENLVVGQSLAIRTPDIIYTVVQGDTLAKIAETYGVSIAEILQNNTRIAETGFLAWGYYYYQFSRRGTNRYDSNKWVCISFY